MRRWSHAFFLPFLAGVVLQAHAQAVAPFGAPVSMTALAGTAVEAPSPTDGPAVRFELPTADGRVVRLLLNVPISKAVGRWTVGHPDSSHGLGASLCPANYGPVTIEEQLPGGGTRTHISSTPRQPCVGIPAGTLTVSRSGSDALEGQIDLVLATGQQLQAPFKAAVGPSDLARPDEISPDGCRLWDMKTNEKMDKDRFRHDLGGEVEAYQEVARRLGLLTDGTVSTVLDMDEHRKARGK